MQMFALLGAHPDISVAELTVLTRTSPSWQAGQLAVFDDVQGNLMDLQNRLGGTQKLAMVVGSLKDLDPSELLPLLVNDLVSDYPDGKLHFGLSIYGNDAAKVNALRAEHKNLGLELKTKLKEAGRSARYVISKDPTLPAVVILNNHLLDKGAEYVLLVREDDILVCKTAAVQNIDDWSKRDFERPRRNAKQGMLPPKLARIMVNLTGVSAPGKTLLDPFCGSGTVLMEAALLGYAHVIGSDIAQGAVQDTNANMDWMETLGVELGQVTTFVSSAEEAPKHLEPQSVDAIVTETYLGRPRQGTENQKDIDEAVKYITTLYEESFGALKGVLKPGGVVLVAAPVHYLNEVPHFVPVADILQRLGYTPAPFACDTLIYRHQDQFVGRQLLRFKLPQ